jgi:hypothetical protein
MILTEAEESGTLLSEDPLRLQLLKTGWSKRTRERLMLVTYLPLCSRCSDKILGHLKTLKPPKSRELLPSCSSCQTWFTRAENGDY